MINTLRPLLWNFLPLIQPLLYNGSTRNNNLVIGGSNALLIHGLELGRPIEDLDLIIYQPNQEQIKVLLHYKPLSLTDGKFDSEDGYGKLQNMKLKRNNMILNIIIEEEVIINPEDLLRFEYIEESWKIQSIQKVIDAKASYTLPSDRGLRYYSRNKDMIDFQNLKNLNFNINTANVVLRNTEMKFPEDRATNKMEG